MKATPKQRKILQMAQEMGGEFTKGDAIELLGSGYYCNEDKHVGDILSRMVNAGFIVRIKPGHFTLAPSRLEKLKKDAENPNQKTLFE